MQATAPALRPATLHQHAGHGAVAVENIANRSTITRLQASSPLKLLTPRTGGPAACIVASTYGGGLLAGDAIELRVQFGEQTRCLLATQASTKIYRGDDLGEAISSQSVAATLAPGAILVSLPDPLVPFAGSRYRGRQRFDLSLGSSLVALDWLSAGRSACGERWAMSMFQTGTEVYLDGRCIFRDVFRLVPADGPVAGPMRMGSIDCFATLLLIGPAVANSAAQLHDKIHRLPAGVDGRVLAAASRFGDGEVRGIVIRLAAHTGTEPLAQWLRQHLSFAIELAGGAFWLRKW